jgi:hypothetical protein
MIECTGKEADPGNIIHGAQIHAIFPYTARTVTAAAVITALQPIFKKVSVIGMYTWGIMTTRQVVYDCRLEYLT